MTDAGVTQVVLIIFLNAFVFWPKRWTREEAIFLNIVATAFNAAFGFNLAAANTLYDTLWFEGIFFIILSLFCIFRTVMILLGRDKKGDN